MSMLLSVAKSLNILAIFLYITMLASPLLICIYLYLVESVTSLRCIDVQRKAGLVMCYTFSTVIVISGLILLDFRNSLMWMLLIAFLVLTISAFSTLNAIKATQKTR